MPDPGLLSAFRRGCADLMVEQTAILRSGAKTAAFTP